MVSIMVYIKAHDDRFRLCKSLIFNHLLEDATIYSAPGSYYHKSNSFAGIPGLHSRNFGI